MFKIEQGIKMPAVGHGIDWPFSKMRLKDCFMVPKHLHIGTVRQAARRFGSTHQITVQDQHGVEIKRDREFRFYKMDDHYRCWRTR